MAKPRRSTAEAFYDVFSDMPIAEQAIALRILQETHRQAVKLNRRKSPLAPQGLLIDGEAGESGVKP